MKTSAGREFEVYEVSGDELRIHWNIVDKSTEESVNWEADEALCLVYDTRASLISKIIRSVYSLDDEFALINNKEDKPDEYAEFQDFRVLAKQLADGWINR